MDRDVNSERDAGVVSVGVEKSFMLADDFNYTRMLVDADILPSEWEQIFLARVMQLRDESVDHIRKKGAPVRISLIYLRAWRIMNTAEIIGCIARESANEIASKKLRDLMEESAPR